MTTDDTNEYTTTAAKAAGFLYSLADDIISGNVIESPFTIDFNLIHFFLLSIEDFFVIRLEMGQKERSDNSINDIDNDNKRQLYSPGISGLSQQTIYYKIIIIKRIDRSEMNGH